MRKKIIWKYSFAIIILLCSVSSFAAEDAGGGFNPYVDGTSAPAPSAAVLSAQVAGAIDQMKKDIVSEVNANNDGNVAALSADINRFQKDFQQKAIIGIIGANILIAGLVFYLLNKSQRGITYSSIEAKRQKEEGDRLTLISAVNDIRSKVGFLEEEFRRGMDTSVVPADQIMNSVSNEPQYEEDIYGGEPYGQPSYPLENQDEAWRY